MKLEGKVAIITGAGRNIGEEIARVFAREGAAVVVNDVDLVGAERVAGEIRADGGRALAVAGDVSNSNDVRVMLDRTVAEFGGLDILVNNAAITVNKSILDTTE
ncbi:MAG: SDR family NAD(P)-dependent oxidoreductase, partial [Chloroflexi bacterium]|nr:SDR family NAD(P)-dependent oxidoreductase [Chloroflexota bacterium]